MRNKKIDLPHDVGEIIGKLQSEGYEAYAVGGCIRDIMLGREPNDWDITTSAKPDEIKRIFRRTVDTGIQHGTVTVLIYHGKDEPVQHPGTYEVTTYRIDGEYEDSRHPREVTFTSELSEDLKRRDFTINAMAYNESEGLVDLYGGVEDLERGIIRCVGDPEERFTEDALRMLRAVRFSAQLGCGIDDRTAEAVRKLCGNLKNISAERIREETVKLITSQHPEYLRKAYELGITAVILPEFDRCMKTPQHNSHHCYSVGEHILHSMMNIAPEPVLRLTMLFHDMGKPDTLTTDEKGITHNHGHAAVSAGIAGHIMRRMKFDNDTIAAVTCLTGYHDIKIEPDRSSVCHAVNKIGEDYFPQLIQVKYADLIAKSEYGREEGMAAIGRIEEIYREITENGDCVQLRGLALTGGDLIKAGMRQGPGIGEMLNAMLQDVLDHPEHNTKEYLMEFYHRRDMV